MNFSNSLINSYSLKIKTFQKLTNILNMSYPITLIPKFCEIHNSNEPPPKNGDTIFFSFNFGKLSNIKHTAFDFPPAYLNGEEGLNTRVFATREIGAFSTRQGDLESTENPLDVAIKGEGYWSKKGWYDNSDSMTDYFVTAYYISMEVGSWNTPYVQK